MAENSELTQQVQSPARASGPAWLLIATVPAYIAYLVLALATIAQDATTSSDLTPGDIDRLGSAWMGTHVLWVVPTILAAIALPRLARPLGTRGVQFVPALAVSAVAFCLGYVVINAMAYTVTAPTWGDSPLYPWSNMMSILAGWLGVHAASLIVLVGMAMRGIARRTSIVVAIVYGLYFAFEVLTYLPIIFGSETFAGFLGGLPPFLVGSFWAVLGITVLRARVPSKG